jgi:hypothetical protein
MKNRANSQNVNEKEVLFYYYLFVLLRTDLVALRCEKNRAMQSLAWEQCNDEGACLVTAHDV